ncbi:MAG: KilA-N domain-containing protein [Chlorobi bacterium]|nr:KilA-N domain-containing protein [Chlorobiota bacterium]
MKNKKNKTIEVKGTIVTITGENQNDYISLTDIARYKNPDAPADIVKNWLRSKNTIELLGFWEKLYNPDFKLVEFDQFKNEAGYNHFVLSPQKWIEKTNAVGIVSKSGRYGGTFAHKDIAFEFASWISVEFKLYLIKEFQRLKEDENNRLSIEWNVKRLLSKTNYHLQTNAVQKHIIPKKNYRKDKQWLIYAEEADLLNVALFGCTAKDWREANPELAGKGMNIRDMASINELTVLSNIESMNSVLIGQGIGKPERFDQLHEIAKYQLQVLNKKEIHKAIKNTKTRS